jgi:hypothetical protein
VVEAKSNAQMQKSHQQPNKSSQMEQHENEKIPQVKTQHQTQLENIKVNMPILPIFK